MMLSSISSRGICQSCRSETRSIIEIALRGAPRSITRLQPPKARHQTPRIAYRLSSNYTTPSIVPQESDSEKLVTHTNVPDGQPDQVLQSQIAVVQEVERQLGISFEQAIAEDTPGVKTLVQSILNQKQSNSTLGDLGNPVTRLRSRGASQDEVVRETRNVFGNSLPRGVLDDEEFALYKRLYGEPILETSAEASKTSESREGAELEKTTQNALYSAMGEEIEYQSTFGKHLEQSEENDGGSAIAEEVDDSEITSLNVSPYQPFNLQDIATSVNGEIVKLDDEMSLEEGEDEQNAPRGHPLTTLGQFATNPRTVFLPQDAFIRPIDKIMSNYSNKQLREMCHKKFGGPGLPDSALTPRVGQFKQQVPLPLEASDQAMGEMEANAFVTAVMPPVYASISSVLVETRKRLGSSWIQRLLEKEGGPRVLDAGSGGVGIIAWREVVQAHWNAMHSSEAHPPPAPATKSVVLTGSDSLRHRAAELLENTTFIPRLPDYAHTRKTPTIEDDRPAQRGKGFDVIIASHSLFGLKEEWMRKQLVQNLWSLLNSDGGVLVIIEKGIPRGFEAVAGAREMLLERYIANPPGFETQYSKISDDDTVSKKGRAMIVAPCTNHEKCPMYTVGGVSRGRKDVCKFQQRFVRPQFLQRILEAKDQNHDDVDFSFLSVMKGDDLRDRYFSAWNHIEDPVSAPRLANPSLLSDSHSTWLDKTQKGFEQVAPGTTDVSQTGLDDNVQERLPAMHTLPRTILQPIKRKGHVTLDVCTPAGKIERWTIPRSFSKQAYRDARKSHWGDLWALGAKTRGPRNLKLGVPEKDLLSKKKSIELEKLGKGRSQAGRTQRKAQKVLEAQEQEFLDDMAEQRELMSILDEEVESGSVDPMDEEYTSPRSSKSKRPLRKSASRATRRTPSSIN